MNDPEKLIEQIERAYSSKVYRDEPILQTASKMKNYLPQKYRDMRALAFQNGNSPMSVAEIFWRQGKFMEDFTDSYDYSGEFFRYFPTYQSMSDAQLRGYFSWRTQVRQGNIVQTSLSFVYVYIYELLNCIGFSSPLEAFLALRSFCQEYRTIDMQINRYAETWMRDFVIRYTLDPALLEDSPAVQFDKQLSVLMHCKDAQDDELYEALCALSTYSPEHSRFCKENPDDTRAVLLHVFRTLSDYYAAHRKYTLCEAFFGRLFTTPYTMFYAAQFFEREKPTDCTYIVSPLTRYTCKNGQWSCTKIWGKHGKNAELGAMFRAADSMMRQAFDYPHALKSENSPKYLQKIIRESIEARIAEKKQNARVHIEIDTSKLNGIRHAASLTRDKLLTEEEITEEQPTAEPEIVSEARPFGLTDAEYTVLRALLYGEPYLPYLREKGLLLSVVTDGINEKCFDAFSDTVLLFDGDSPELIEDYIDELKGLL